MHRRSGFRLLAIAIIVAMLVPAWGTATARQATPEAAPAGENLITGQRQNAVPLGETGRVGNLEVVVTGFTQDASALANPESSYPAPANRTIINVELSLTNTGTETLDARTVTFMTAGNRGLLLRSPSSDICIVDGNVQKLETVVIAPGATAAGNFCTLVLTDDVASLQFFALPNSDLFERGIEAIASGTWFNLGAPEAFDPSIGEAATAAARDGAVTGTLDDPANPSNTVLVNNVAVTLVEYIPDATTDFAALDSFVSDDANLDTAYAMFDLVNTGTTPAVARASLLDESGVSGNLASIPDEFREVTGAGYLLPGGSASIHGAWEVPTASAATRAFRFTSTTESAWMLAAAGNSAAWNLPPVDLAVAASTDVTTPVPYGQTASVAGLNFTLAPGGAYEHLLTIAVAEASPDGDQIFLTIDFGQDASESCSFVTEFGNSTTFAGSFNRIVLPGAQQTLDISCDDGGTTPLTVSVQQGGAEEVIGIFARSGDVQAQPAGEPVAADDTTATEPAAEQPADAASSSGETATVIAATANVRAEPTTSGAIVAVVAAGDVVTITGEGVAADGYTWLPVTLADGTTGWIAEQLIQRG